MIRTGQSPLCPYTSVSAILRFSKCGISSLPVSLHFRWQRTFSDEKKMLRLGHGSDPSLSADCWTHNLSDSHHHDVYHPIRLLYPLSNPILCRSALPGGLLLPGWDDHN